MKFITHSIVSSFLAALVIAAPTAATAGSPPSAKAPSAKTAPGAKAAPVKMSQKQLKQFAATYDDLSKTQAKYVEKLKKAGNKADKTKVRQNAQKVMLAMIQKHGMTVQKYRQTAIAISKSPQLQRQLQKIEANRH